MSDYTPTTDEVRDCYATGAPCGEDLRQRLEQKFRDDYAEFDRWLNAERARIWDEVINAMKYEDGTPVELVANINPYRSTHTRAAKLEGK